MQLTPLLRTNKGQYEYMWLEQVASADYYGFETSFAPRKRQNVTQQMLSYPPQKARKRGAAP